MSDPTVYPENPCISLIFKILARIPCIISPLPLLSWVSKVRLICLWLAFEPQFKAHWAKFKLFKTYPKGLDDTKIETRCAT
jgi:hypothetical protein